METKPWFEMILKIIIIGDPSVGKTSLLRRIIDNKFSSKYTTTLGVDFSFKHLNINGKQIKLQIWDTAGQEQYRSLITTYYRHTNGVIIVFDLSDMNSFDNILKNWIGHVVAYVQDHSPKLLILGNKLDLQMKSRDAPNATEIKSRLEANGKCILRDLSLNPPMMPDTFLGDQSFCINGGNWQFSC
jgi:Ras-related protein Rab-1A